MIRPKNKKSSLLLSLALLAFLVRSLIPIGFMPGHDPHNTYPLVICSGAGPVTINVPADKLPYNPHPQHDSHDNMPCTYAQAFAQGMLADFPALVVPVFSEPVLFQEETALSLNTTVKNYFSHGPPAFLA
jgi:hypothetical protein